MRTPESSIDSIRSIVRATSLPKRLCSMTTNRSNGGFFAFSASSMALRPGRSKVPPGARCTGDEAAALADLRAAVTIYQRIGAAEAGTRALSDL